MASRTVKTVLTADVKGFTAGMAAASKQAQDFGSGMSDSISQNEQHLNTLAGSLGKIGLVLGAGVGLAVKTFADFDESMSQVAATGDDARGSLDALRQAAIDAGASTSFSATEAASGIENLAKAGVSAEDILAGGLAGALDLAAAGSVDVGFAAEAAATAMTQFGLSGKDVPHIADLLAAAAGKAQGEVSDMAAALNQSGLVASSMGLSIEETTGSLAAFASAGLIGSDAGTSFKSMLQRLANPAGKAAGEMERLGISAYDAQGNFVGMSDLAGQLKTALDPLPQSQRDAAMSIIFGSDAVRAANVLYQQGAEGIDGWISAVDDTGFAAETAATKMDNLKGDLEGMSGAFETAMIGLGEGADGPLRSLVQSVTDVINKFNELGSGTKGAILVTTAALAGLALGGAAVIKMVTSVNAAVIAVRGLSTASPAAAGAVGKLGKAAGIAAAAFVGFQILGAVSRQFNDNFTPSVSEATGALVELADTPNANLDDKFKFETGVVIKDRVDGLGDAFTRLGKNSFADELAEGVDNLANTTDAPTTKIRLQFEQLDAAMVDLGSSGSGAQAAASFAKIAEEADGAGYPLEKLIALFPGYEQQVRAAAKAAGVKITSDEQMAAIMGGDIPEAMQAAMAATDSATGATEGNTTAVDAQAAALQSLQDQVRETADAMLQLSGSEIGVEAAIDAAREAAEKNGRTLDISTEAGRANKTALDDLARSSLAHRDAMIQNGDSTDVVSKKTARAREQFVKTAQKMSMSKEEAERLAAAYFDIPDDATTLITAPGAKLSKKQAEEVERAIKDIDPYKQAEIRTIARTQGIEAARRALASLRNKTVYATTIHRTIYRSTGGGKQKGPVAIPNYDGGLVPGYSPHPKADNILSWLTAKEFVHPVAAVKYYGADFMEALRTRSIPREQLGIAKHADGGQVGAQHRIQSYVPRFADGGSVTSVRATVDTSGFSNEIRSALQGMRIPVNMGGLTFEGMIDFQIGRTMDRARRSR